ncbi:MAG: hypothetical protein V9H69_05180 [Anaerolineae bacterium]
MAKREIASAQTPRNDRASTSFEHTQMNSAADTTEHAKASSTVPPNEFGG